MSKEKDGYQTQIELGSNGKLYDDKLPDGSLVCTPWTTTEEMLLNSSINTHILIDKLIKNCCQLPKGLDPDDLTNHDRFQIFFHQRNISYPRPYSFQFRCSECGEKATAKVDLSKLELRKLGLRPLFDEFTDEPIVNADGVPELEPYDFEYPIQVELPRSGTTVGWRFLTGKDEKKAEKYERQVRNKNPHLQGDAGYSYRLALRIVSIDGEDVKFSDALTFARGLVGEDSLALRDSFDDFSHGIIPRVEPDCNHCGWSNGPFMLPFDESFFRPKSDRGHGPH